MENKKYGTKFKHKREFSVIYYCTIEIHKMLKSRKTLLYNNYLLLREIIKIVKISFERIFKKIALFGKFSMKNVHLLHKK